MIDGIPPEWLRKPFGELCSQRREMLHNLSGNQDRYVGLEHLDSGIARVRRWGQADDLRSSKFRFQRGDVLYGKLRPYLDKSALAEWDGICSTEIVPFTPKVGIAEPAFLSYLVHCSEFVSYAVAHTTGVNHPRASLTDVERYEVAVPPLPEQRAIAAVLTKLQQAVELQEKTVTTLKELKAATMAKLFREGLRGERLKQTEIGEVPESWEVVKIREVFDVQLGKMLSPKARTGESPLPYLRNKNVQWGRLDLEDVFVMDFSAREYEKYLLRKDDLLVCEGGEPGRTALWNEEIPGCLYQKALLRLRPKDKRRILPKYYLYWAETAFTVFKSHAPTGTKTTIAHLPQEKLEVMTMALPVQLDEQTDIVKTIDVVMDRLQNAERKLQGYQALFNSTLHQLMTGQVRVTGIMDADGILKVGGGG